MKRLILRINLVLCGGYTDWEIRQIMRNVR